MPNKWTREEQKQMIVELKNGDSLEVIAKKHNRTIMAVEIRIQKIVYDAINKGTGFEKMAEIMGMSKKELLTYYKAYVQFMKTNKIVPDKNKDKNNQNGGSKVSKNELENDTHNTHNTHNDIDKIKRLEKLAFKLAVENKILKKVIKNITKNNK